MRRERPQEAGQAVVLGTFGHLTNRFDQESQSRLNHEKKRIPTQND